MGRKMRFNGVCGDGTSCFTSAVISANRVQGFALLVLKEIGNWTHNTSREVFLIWTSRIAKLVPGSKKGGSFKTFFQAVNRCDSKSMYCLIPGWERRKEGAAGCKIMVWKPFEDRYIGNSD